MNVEDIKEIMELFSSSEASTLKIKEGGFSLTLQKGTKERALRVASSPVSNEVVLQAEMESPRMATPTSLEVSQMPASKAVSADYITSPMVGTFYKSPSPGADPYISVGDIIKKGTVIGIVEAMKIMNEIEAEFDCKVLSIEVGDAQPVEYGSKLVMVEKV
ncbi:acetyl-CoA carboxylase biotin carboxyl carrier protein [Helicobacter sp. 11S02629-2]|uniref:acetyl-CoA carboxylase biotin carboxyl carrier protein n=1 Tax=Helicobacter sp. 11S02629-2 TaxID=1476195 RepID=UPI000BA78D41|nr:acetyl-CoA carboxylase biotin carboxyl carrier protein [Helicobacter sp. 11S02629-2]PAF46072.1 acetyl-CoA carboxylase, biotin carboxyl carrier protein [Helicobacter sp. 11S02629-2]